MPEPIDAARISLTHASTFRRRDHVRAIQLSEVAVLRVDEARSQIGKPGNWLVQLVDGSRVILDQVEFDAIFEPHMLIERVEHQHGPRHPGSVKPTPGGHPFDAPAGPEPGA